jgi:hypothetical protein
MRKTRKKNMKLLFSTVCLSFMLSICGQTHLFAKDIPTSAEQLRAEVESVLKAKDTNAFTALFNWQGVSDEMKSETKDENADLFSHDIVAVKLTALSADFQTTNELNGVRYKPNVTVIGMISVEYTEKGNAVSMPYGKWGDAFYLSSTVEEKIAAPTVKEKSLNVMVMGVTSPEKVAFTGSFVNVKAGKEINGDISGSGNRSEAFWGDYIKSCSIQKTSDDGWIKLIISEDGKKIFESEKITNKEPVVYEKK